LTPAKVQRLVELGRMHGADEVTTARATYRWNAMTSHFERVEAL